MTMDLKTMQNSLYSGAARGFDRSRTCLAHWMSCAIITSASSASSTLVNYSWALVMFQSESPSVGENRHSSNWGL